MRALLVSALLLAACDGSPLDETTEEAARGALERDHLTEIRLHRVDERTFDFTGLRGEARCEGTVVVNVGPGGRSAAIQSRCE